MKRTEAYRELEELIGIEKGLLSNSKPIKDVEEWDSMAIMSFIAFAEENFSIVVEGDQVQEAKTFGELFDLIGDKLE
ncbi:MAG TPA: acyl carrier protein [Anaerolineae bacterium]|nr:acyl carrier protein [Anaerolineae bacterium]